LFDAADVARLEVAEMLPEIGDGDCRHGLDPACAAGQRCSRGPARSFPGSTSPPPLWTRGRGIHPVCTRLRYSTPTLPAATSRRAMTVGLSRVVSTCGVPPWAS